ncbi:MAG: glycosyltransferase family 9 protein [Planctomycetes bacterium]|nr:glycosyltransferase family 9 protein [Planctomycetota bacterium]
MPQIPAERIGLVKLGAIGDVVNTLPFANRLRAGYPKARITWVIAPLSHALLEGHPAVDEFLVFDAHQPTSWPAFVRELRARRLDLAIDLQRLIKSGMITRTSGAKTRLGFDPARCKERSHLFTNLRIPANPAPGVTVAQYLEFADFLQLPAQIPTWRLPHTPFAGARAGERIAVLNVGASWSSKLWANERWSELARRLTHELELSVHLSGGPGDRAAAADIARAAGVPVVSHAGEFTLRETAGLLAAAELVVSGDTGPLHMAVALARPVVALFGAADPRRTAPFGQPHSVVRNPVDCSPCRKRECPVPGHPCMSGLEVEVVFARAREVLGASALAP